MTVFYWIQTFKSLSLGLKLPKYTYILVHFNTVAPPPQHYSNNIEYLSHIYFSFEVDWSNFPDWNGKMY